MSLIVDEVPDPYNGEHHNIKNLIKNSIQDEEQSKFDKLDYLQLMYFWEEYI